MVTDTRTPRYLATLAAAAAAILALGLLLKPDSQHREASEAPSPTETRRLRRLSLRQAVEGVAEYFALAASDLESSLVSLEGAETSGVVWGEDFVVSSGVGWSPSRTAILTRGTGEAFPAVRSVAGPHLPVTGYQAAIPQGLIPPARNMAAPDPGEWLVAAWRGGLDLTYAPGTAIGAGDTICGERRIREVRTSIPLSPVMVGGGIFDLDGRLSAVILPCDGRVAAIAVPSVDALLRAGNTDQSRLLARYGMRLDKLTPGEQEHFQLEHGTIVRELWRGYPAEMVGLEPGDMFLELDGEPVQEAAVEEMLLSATQEGFELRVRRGRETLTVHLPPDGIAIPPPAPRESDAGIVWASEHDEGYPVGNVVAGSRAAAAGIRPGDRVLRLQHATPTSLAQVKRTLAATRSGSAFVAVSRGERLLGLLLGPIAEAPA
jgi:hypothetical protein